MGVNHEAIPEASPAATPSVEIVFNSHRGVVTMEVDGKANPKPKISMAMKLMVNKRNRRVMYAEAGKEFVDLLVSILTLPTGSIAKLALRNDPSANNSCIANLYNSVENFPDFLMKSTKSILLDPKVVSTTYTNEILDIQSPPPPKPAEPPTYYTCYYPTSSYYNHSLSTQSGTVVCPCGYTVNREVSLVDPAPQSKPDTAAENGYVKNKTKFAITDDLSIIPVNSTATIANLWNKIGIREPTELEERNITVGANEVVGLLKAAMLTNTALNDVFKAEKNYSAKVPEPARDTDSARVAFQQILLKLLREDQKLK